MKPKLICIIGETASGKDKVVHEAIARITSHKIRTVCSYTDRPIRKTETDGVEHYFVTTDEFNYLKKTHENDILAYTHIKNANNPNHKGYQYMAFIDELYKSHIYVIDYCGLLNLKARYGDTVDTVLVYITAPYETRLNRARASRSDFNTEFKTRVDAEEAQFSNFRNSDLQRYTIYNDDGEFDSSVNLLCEIIVQELLDDTDISNYPKQA